MTESEIKKQCREYSDKAKLIWKNTSDSRKSRNTKGTSDTFVTKRGLGNRWLALEFKTESGKLSPEQIALEAIGAISVIRSLDDFVKAVKQLQ